MTLSELLTFRSRDVHIVGASSAEGFAIIDFLCGLGFTHLTAHDTTLPADMPRSFDISHVSLPQPERGTQLDRLLHELPITRRFGPDYLTGIDSAELIFATQNWFAYDRNRPIRAARDRGIPVRFLVQLYFDLSPAPIAAVTGTNGKTTVSNLLHHLIRHSPIPVLMSGNDRYHPQVLNRLDSLPSDGCLVLEISNRQLKELERGPHIAIITNIEPDHIEDHGSFEAYIDAKARLFERQPRNGFALINADNPAAASLATRASSQVVRYSIRSIPEGGIAAFIRNESAVIVRDAQPEELFRVSDLKIPGPHNLANALAAASAAFLIGVAPDTIRASMLSFPGVHNRIEHIQTVEGIDYYDDLASTNPAATRAALEAFAKPIVLIAGGDAKGNLDDYATLGTLCSSRLRGLILLPGDAGEAIAENLTDRIPIHRVTSLDEAVREASQIAQSGDAVVLSPAGAAFFTRFIAPSPGYRRLIRDLQRKARRR